MQSFIVDCPTVSNTSASYSDGDYFFFVCEIKEQPVTSSSKSRLCNMYVDVSHSV